MLSMRPFNRRRGFSLSEMLFSVSMFGISGLFVAVLLVEVARHSQSSLSMIPSELSAYRVIDRLRSELLPASAWDIAIEGAPVVVDGKQVALEGNAVTFTNPAREQRSRIWFENGACLLTPDINSTSPQVLVLHEDLQNLSFRFPDRLDRRRVEIVVATRGEITSITRNARRINIYSDHITLRN